MVTIYKGDSLPNNHAGPENEMYGYGAGDRLVGENSFQFTTIYGGTGDDKLYLSVLTGAFGQIEGGSGNDKIYGGDRADNLYGAKDNDLIEGNDGADFIFGGQGNDKLYGSDRTFDFPDTGDTIYGGSGKDRLFGQDGNDWLYGGKGKDTLTGGNGFDNFVFDEKASASNVQAVTDFDVSRDLIYLNNGRFEVGSAGVLNPNLFHIGKHANSSDVRIVYNRKSGDLLYTPDGNDSNKEIVIAELSKKLALDFSDFVVFNG